MATIRGHVLIQIEAEVDDGLDDLEQEKAFNEAVLDAWNTGDLADHDFTYDEEG